MKKIQRIDYLYEALRVVLGILIAYALCLVIIVLLTGVDGWKDALYNFAVGPFTTTRRFAQVLSRMAPYMLVGCGMCFVYASGRFSVISEGIINIAPVPIILVMFNTSFGLNIMPGLPKIVNQLILIVTCGATGAVIAMIPAYGREKLGASETVTSIVLNSVCVYIALALIRNFAADRTQSFIATPNYPASIRFARYFGNTNLSEGIWVAVIGVIIACVIFYRTKLGAEIRITGANPTFAKYAGINTSITPFMGQVLGGIFAGVAGAVENFGAYNQYQMTMLTNIGMDGLIIAVMAKKHPIFVPITAFVLAYIRTAASVLNTNTKIPIELVTMLQAVIIFFVAAEEFLGKSRQRAIIKASRAEA
ncbi:MAG: ABC transporter permease [Oscillospiraceae bacterium]|nr:ABC transporter permease [Oscillospiraceae bacterium]